MADQDREDPEREMARLTFLLMICYDSIRETLTYLPIPIELPNRTEGADVEDMILALIRAIDLLEDEPVISPETRTDVWMLLLDWLATYEHGALIQMAGATSWRLSAMEMAIARMTIMGKAVFRALSDSGDEPDDD